MILLIALGVTLVFLRTNAFYGAGTGDVIYSADSRSIVFGNAYMTLLHKENDLRQPLFAAFSAPIMGSAYLIAAFFHGSQLVWALLISYIQALLLFASFYLFARMMHLTPGRRACFLLLACCSYPYLLYSLMMEQYVIAVFWLSLSVYLISEKRESCPIPLYAAMGTLLTSGAWLLASSNESPVREFGKWLRSMILRGVGFVLLLLGLDRFDIIGGILAQVKLMTVYGGIHLTWADKLRQFLAFLRNCFLAPEGYARLNSYGTPSWWPDPVTAVDFVGVAIVALLVVSRIVNRDKRSTRLAFGWFLFSLVLLVGAGWGARENCLILYSLYFGWAILMLLFQLVEWVADRFHSRLLVPLATAAGVCAFLAVNLPELGRMIAFAIENYPR